MTRMMVIMMMMSGGRGGPNSWYIKGWWTTTTLSENYSSCLRQLSESWSELGTLWLCVKNFHPVAKTRESKTFMWIRLGTFKVVSFGQSLASPKCPCLPLSSSCSSACESPAERLGWKNGQGERTRHPWMGSSMKTTFFSFPTGLLNKLRVPSLDLVKR